MLITIDMTLIKYFKKYEIGKENSLEGILKTLLIK